MRSTNRIVIQASQGINARPIKRKTKKLKAKGLGT
jgi:hypothetical protein